MSNEELAVLIKEGKTEYYLQLWEQNKLLLYKYLHSFKHKYENRIAAHGLTDEDIMQELFFAIAETVNAFDNKKEYKFTTYLKYYIKKCFSALIGLNRKADALNNCLSLDNLLKGNEEDGTFLENIEDENASEGFCKVEDAVYYSELQKILFEAMQNNLTEAEHKRIEDYYFNNKTVQAISKEANCSASAVSFSIRKGIKKIRDSEDAERLNKYCGFDLYNGNGYKAFKDRGYSSVEMVVECMLKNAGKVCNSVQ